MSEHWASAYMGKPWVYGGRGPDEFDCWGFVCWVQREHFGVVLPAVDVPATWAQANALLSGHGERHNWQAVQQPQEGDVVMLARQRLPIHIGVAAQANGKVGVLHCLEGAGVVFQDRLGLRLNGWGSLTYYRRKHAE